jgi:6-phosphogluconolactonase (cycloisomerase 2 family)
VTAHAPRDIVARMKARSLLALAALSTAAAAWVLACTDDDVTPNRPEFPPGSLDSGASDATSRPDVSAIDSSPDSTSTDASTDDAGAADASDSDAGPADASSDSAPIVDADTDAAAVTGGPFVYFAKNTNNAVVGYKLTSGDGGLSQVDMNPDAGGVQAFATANQPSTVAAHPNGKFLFSAHFNSPVIVAYAIDAATGVLTRRDVDGATPGVQDFSLCAGFGGGYIAADPKGRVLYFSDSTGDRLVTLSVDGATGALAVVSTLTMSGSEMRAFAVSPQADFLFVVSSSISPLVTRLALDPTTGLPTAGPLPHGGYPSVVLSGAGNCVSATVGEDGQLYTSCSQDGKLHAVGASADGGALVSLGAASVGAAPLPITTHPNKNFAYSATFSAQQLHSYSIALDAGPAAIGSPVSLGESCRTLAFDATGTLMLAGCDSKMISLSVDGTTGVATVLGSASFGSDSGYSMAIVYPPL